MKRQNNKIFLTLWLLASLFWQTIPVKAQQISQSNLNVQELSNSDGNQVYKNLLQQAQGAEFPVLLEKIFGGDAQAAADVFNEDSEQIFQAVTTGASDKAEENLETQIAERRKKTSAKTIVAPAVKTNPAKKAVKKAAPKSRKLSFNNQPKLDWRQFTFGFHPLSKQEEKPDVKFMETEKEIKAEGSDKKSFETKEAKGTRTQKAETRYIKDGKTFGVEIKDTQIIEAVSKADGKSFRREISLLWGAEVAACPDVNGVPAGTGKARVVSKTIYVENGVTVTMTSEFDLQAKLIGYVNDQATLTHYDLQLDAYTTNSGYEDALRLNIIKEIKIKDGRYGLHYDIPGNTIEVSDGKYGGKRTPAKIGKATARLLIPMSDADTEIIGKAIGPMVPSIWNSANEMYKTAEKNWKNYGCVEVVCKVPKTTLKEGEEIVISTESVHLQDGGKINAQLKAEAYEGGITPESQAGTPTATFTFTQSGENNPSFSVESVSKRGIGRGDVEFQLEKEKEENTEAGVWTGTITARRDQREEKEKRSGANLAENGGYLETNTNVRLQLTGRLDRSVDATNAYVANVTGEQKQIDYEYDRYKIDEGYCGPNAVPYKGPKEITRTSTTTTDYNKETRVYVEIGRTSGTLTFSLPETTGRTIHSYVHKSPCDVHDRANTNEAIDEDVATVGGNFSFSFPVDGLQKTIKGSISVREEDGSTTVYTWELTRR
ncbi:MAG: hypothetical protein M3209_06350 [Acidobacteriota bacterium]|nr:hypothetical protein [Acidobacteriota bacterium]